MATNRAILFRDELESLRVLSSATKWTRVPTGHGEKVTRCGFAAGQTGRLAITMSGRAKLVIEVTRASWRPVLN